MISESDFQDLLGMRITRLRQACFELQGTTELGEGPLEVTFGDRVLLLTAAPDGEALRVERHEWLDPFDNPSGGRDNADYIREFGKRSAIDLGGTPLGRVVGASLSRAQGLTRTRSFREGRRHSPSNTFWDDCRPR